MSEFRQRRFQLPPDAAELLLIRHGESEAFLDGQPFPLLDGHGDPALSERGRQQAELIGQRLRTAGIDAIYATNLRRTAQTAAPLAARLGVPVRVEADLREVHLGVWEGGLYRKMVAQGDPISLRMFELERWDVIPGAESGPSFEGRVRAAIGRLAASHAGQRVAVFTHGGVIGQVLASASGSRAFAFVGADNGSISSVVVAGDRWAVRGFNDVSHLPPS